MLIGEQEFLRIIPDDRNREYSGYYLKHGTFERFSIQYDEEQGNYLVDALFRARYYKNHVQIVIDAFQTVVGIACDCAYCRPHQGCAHVGAVLLKLFYLPEVSLPYFETQNRQLEELLQADRLRKQRERRRFLLKQEEETGDLIEKYRRRFEQNTALLALNQPVQLCVQLEKTIGYQGVTTLIASYRIGQKKHYRIKDLEQFLRHIDLKENVTYGKSLTFDHDWAGFDEEARQQIDFLRRQRQDLTAAPIYGRFLTLNEENLDAFFDLYSSLSYECSGLVFKTEKSELALTAKQVKEADRDYWRFTMEPTIRNPLLSKQYVYTLENGCLRRICFDENGKGVELMRQFIEKNEVFVADKQLEHFYKYVLSDLEDRVIVEGLPSEMQTSAEHDFKLYGDLDESGEICLTVTYRYGNEKGYALDPQHPAKSLKLEKIEKILSYYADRIDPESHQIFMNAADAKAWQFVQTALTQLAKCCEIYVSDALKHLGSVKKLDLRVGISFSEDLLQIDLDSVDVDRQEIFDILRAYRRKKRFHRLKNGQLLALNSPQLGELSELMDELGVGAEQWNGNHVSVGGYRALAADELTGSLQSLEFERQKSFEDFLKRIQTPPQTSPLPEHYEPILRDYQKTGVNWLKKIAGLGFGGILADDMGLGKTIQVIAYLESEQQPDRKSLVVCPSSLLLNWQDEIRRFSSRLSCVPILGSAAARKALIEERIEACDVAIISYDYLRRDIEYLKDRRFFTVILDEAQYIKNQKTRNALSVKQLNAEHRFALTGTPIENSLAELWSIFDFLMPNYLYPYSYFQSEYERPIVKENDEKISERLKKRVEPFILRRIKKDVLKELPDKIENTYTISFDEEEKKLYLANLLQVNEELQSKMKIDQIDRIAVLAMLTRLRQLCCEPRMIYENISAVSSKLRGCMELISALWAGHHKVLLFSSFTTALDLIAEQLDQAGIRYLMLTGKTDKQTRRQRIAQFQSDDTAVFLISLKAGGTGLNLTAAEAVIHYDPWWNVSAQNQATDRAYRIGQTRNVQVYKLIMKDSIEEKILALQEKKKNLADTFTEGSGGSIAAMSVEEIADLLRM